MSDHLESRVFDIRKSCVEYQLFKVKHKYNEIHNQNHNKQNNKDNEPKSTTAMYGSNGVQKHTIQMNYKWCTKHTIHNELQAWRANFTCEEARVDNKSRNESKQETPPPLLINRDC